MSPPTFVHPSPSSLRPAPGKRAFLSSPDTAFLIMSNGDVDLYELDVRQGHLLVTDWSELSAVLPPLAEARNQVAIAWLTEHAAAVIDTQQSHHKESWTSLWDNVASIFPLFPLSPSLPLTTQALVSASLQSGLPFPTDSSLHISPINRAARVLALCLLPSLTGAGKTAEVLPPADIERARKWILGALEVLPWPFASAHHHLLPDAAAVQSHQSNEAHYTEGWNGRGPADLGISSLAWALDSATAVHLKFLTSCLAGRAVSYDQAATFRSRLKAWPTADQGLSATVGSLHRWPEASSIGLEPVLDPSSVDELVFPCVDPRVLGRSMATDPVMRARVRSWLLKEFPDLGSQKKSSVLLFLVKNAPASSRNDLIRHVLPVVGSAVLPSTEGYTAAHAILSWFPTPHTASLVATSFGGEAFEATDFEGNTPLDYARFSLEGDGSCTSPVAAMARIEHRILAGVAARVALLPSSTVAALDDGGQVQPIRRPARRM